MRPLARALALGLLAAITPEAGLAAGDSPDGAWPGSLSEVVRVRTATPAEGAARTEAAMTPPERTPAEPVTGADAAVDTAVAVASRAAQAPVVEASPRPGPAPLAGAAPAPGDRSSARSQAPAAPHPFGQSGTTLLIGSLVMAALLWAGARLVKRLPVGRLLPRADGPIRVVARTHLGAKERLCLIEVGSTSILLALTPTQIQTLHVWPQGTPGVPAPDAASGLAAERASLDGVDVPGQLRDLRLRMTAPRR